MRGGQTETEKIFLVGRECTSLQRGIPRRNGGSGGGGKMIRFGTYII